MSYRTFATIALATLLLAALPAHPANREVTLTVDPARTAGRVDLKVYGHFLEHIYHSVNGGLWGEMVWHRSFEDGAGGAWSVDRDTLAQTALNENVRLPLGDPAWTDYEFTLEACKTAGEEGFLVLFRHAGNDDFYWANLGGWGNTRHGVERGNAGRGRWGTVGRTANGSIATGRWYRIKVRCEGPRVQVFLDDDKVIDFTDAAPLAHPRGRVGIGTWTTAARFRNLKVTALDGKTLFDGLPADLATSSTATGWKTFGPGRFEWSVQAPLNGDRCQVVTPPAGGEAGVTQAPYAIAAGERYAGSLWARAAADAAAAPGRVTVRLLDGERVLAEQTLPPVQSKWQEFSFTLQPTASAPDTTLQVAVKGGSVALDQVSLMSDASRRTGGFRPDLLQAVNDLRPPLIRWPGGCFAEYYNWKDGIGPQHRRVKYPRSIWDDQDTNSYGTDEFIAMCRKTGAEPLLVINSGMHEPPENRAERIRYAQEWVEYCNGPADSTWGKVRAANGHPEPYNVKYWEIDNETWRMGTDKYSRVVRDFGPALKQVDPTIKILACGSGGFDLKWNREVIANCAPFFDYLSIHHYEDPRRFADGPGRYEDFFNQTARLVAASANPKIKLFVSEWNAQSTDWRTGLYAGGILNAMERTDAVEIASPALMLRHVSATAWDNSFINHDHRTWFPAPNYVVMKLFRDRYAPVRLATDGDPGPINVVATRSDDARTLHLKAVNPSDAPVDVTLTLPANAYATATLDLVAPDALTARNTLDAPDAVKPASASVTLTPGAARFTLPRWSVGVLTVRQADRPAPPPSDPPLKSPGSNVR